LSIREAATGETRGLLGYDSSGDATGAPGLGRPSAYEEPTRYEFTRLP